MQLAAPTAYLGVHPPHTGLASLVIGYWVIADLAGVKRDAPVRTAPHPAAIVTVNLGRPCVGEFAIGAVRESIIGVQTVARTWWSDKDCYFAMVLLSLPGVARLFPSTGGASADDQLELGAVLGDREVRGLQSELTCALTPARICACLDAWLLRRLRASRAVAECARFTAAYDALARTGRVDHAARAAGVSARQLERWFTAHAGHSPKAIAGLQRVHRSLHATQTGLGDPRGGFADQPHQIRSWRRHLATTPGTYAKSAMADVTAEGIAHFL